MRRLAHLSDLHFGTAAPETVEALLSDLVEFAPDLIVITGDLTQRAREREFVEARGFLARLTCPCLVVPGNHDVASIYRPFSRLVAPFGGFRKQLGLELEAVYRDDEVLVVGLNTAEPFFWKEGSISEKQLAWVAEQSSNAASSATGFRIVAAHHPLRTTRMARLLPAFDPAYVAERLTYAGVQLCLSGHLHRSGTTSFPDGFAEPSFILSVGAATATSRRLRGENNSYNRLALDFPRLDVTVQGLQSPGHFGEVRHERFLRNGGAWLRS